MLIAGTVSGGFDDYIPCRIKNCNLKHIINWLNLFVNYHDNELKMLK
jgi:putative transposase